MLKNVILKLLILNVNLDILSLKDNVNNVKMVQQEYLNVKILLNQHLIVQKDIILKLKVIYKFAILVLKTLKIVQVIHLSLYVKEDILK